MPRINLLPWREELRNQRRNQFYIALGAAAVSALLVVGLATLTFNAIIDHQNDRNGLLKTEIADLDKLIEEIIDLEDKKDGLLARMEIIEQLQRSRPGIVHVFEELVRTLPDGVHLREIKQTGNRVEIVGLAESNLVMGKHSGRAALRDKLSHLGFEVGDNQLKDVFVRFKELADRKKEIYDDDLIALMRTTADPENDRLKLTSLRVVCGTTGPQTAELTMEIDGKEQSTTQTGDGPVDASFNAIKALVPHSAKLQLYQVHAVTEGTDAQATVSVRMEEDGRIVTGQSANTDTVVASALAYIHALNRLLMRREKAGKDKREISYKDVS